jgi:hypothetical protein
MSKSDSASLATQAFVEGAPDHATGVSWPAGAGYDDILEASGLPDAIPYAVVATDPDAFCTHSSGRFRTIENQLVLPKARLSDVTSMKATHIRWDWEVQDNHSIADTLAFFSKSASIAAASPNRTFDITLYTNSLIQGVATKNGLSGKNIDAVCALIAYCDILVTDFNLSTPFTVTNNFRRQLAMFITTPHSKLECACELGNPAAPSGATTLADAYTVCHLMRAEGFGGLAFFGSGASRGGTMQRLTNLKVRYFAEMANC